MLTMQQVQDLALHSGHRVVVLEEALQQLTATNQKLAAALQEAEALIARLRKPPDAPEPADEVPGLPPIVPPPAQAIPDDDGVARALDELALLHDPVPA